MSGWVSVIAGCMFAGKSEEMIRRVRRSQLARVRTLVIKPVEDTRYDSQAVVSHNGHSVDAVRASTAVDILNAVHTVDARLVAIDEVQFLDASIIPAIEQMASEGRHVILAGLDMDYTGKPFGPIPTLMACADDVTKLHAVCTVCGVAATRTQRIVDSQEQYLVAAESAYEARCRAHWNSRGAP